jgi:hypothetical protein
MTNLRRLTPLQIKVIVVLMDCKGHPLWELEDIIGTKKNNLLTKAIYPLLNMEIIEKTSPRPTTRSGSAHPNKKEIPYVLSTKTNFLESAWWCLMARDHELQAEKAKIYATMEASGFIPENYANRLNGINQEIMQLGKQMKALTILMKNLDVLLEDKKEYLNLLEELRLSNLSRKEFNEIFESLELNAKL